MSDLISRKAVIDTLKQNGIIVDNELGNLIVDEINRIPTAYDVDKVVEQLEEEYISAICWNNKPCNYPETIGCCYDRAINKAVEIVKGGGQGE